MSDEAKDPELEPLRQFCREVLHHFPGAKVIRWPAPKQADPQKKDETT